MHDSGSLCFGCHFVPLTNERIPYVSQALVDALTHKRLLDVRVDQHRETFWKRALPSLVERCRTSWNHNAKCEYRKESFWCPLSVVHRQLPIRTYGEGVDTHTLPKVFHGFALHATRIATPTKSSIPNVEKMAVSAVVNPGPGMASA